MFGYKNRENVLAKTGLILGVLAILILVFIKIVLPISTGVATPLIISESCSMHHNQKGFTDILEKSHIYAKNSISFSDVQDWDFQNGINKGDLVFIISPKNLEVGDVILFRTEKGFTFLHRVVSTNPIATKGDNNVESFTSENNVERIDETNISQERIIGKAFLRIPFVGWSRLIFSDFRRAPQQKGFC